ncbi:DUF421 domain-containing protein [Thalassorhabdus alkalitolerans]|uniref:DUF421 domain-containing protein n=1 Tax=Thalassorhabdus alkalitolerans TaxID=2282697 RepID=A0ABW0YM58_9BACI
MDPLTILIRTLLVYIFLLIILRVMGKRELGQLSILDFVVSIMIAELAVISIENIRMSMLEAFLPIVLLSVIQIALAFLSLKSEKIRHLVDGTPSYIIKEGKIDEKEMRRQRYNFDDLMMQLRQKNIKDLSDVEFAILEPSGELSVFEENDEDQISMPLPFIIDGVIQHSHLKKAGKNELWLRRELRKAGIKTVKEVSYCAFRADGTMFVDLDDNKK